MGSFTDPETVAEELDLLRRSKRWFWSDGGRPRGGDPVHLGQLAKIGLRVGKVCNRFKVAKHFELEIA
ncbi:MAG TPA: hypothetical protein VKF14_20890 [Candidatus Dormibacteraeota bacterium]|nr:hypothetical protein [Candidatus Dormibacteraeota bacterium]